MANLITVRLQRNQGQPWGFRLQGGKDFSSPLVLQRVNGGSVADQVGLMAGDALVKVNSTEVFNLRHKEAQDVIMGAGNSFELTVSRGTAWRPSVTPTGSIPSPSPSLPGNITPVTKTSLAATPQPVQHIGSAHNQAAKPFAAQEVNGTGDQIKSIVNNQYNTPVAMYSDETIAETLSSQAEVLAGGVLGVNFKKNERVYSPANSEVYKLLHEQGNDPEPAYQQQHQPQQQQQQQQQVQQHQQQQQQSTNAVTRHVTAPVDKPPSANTNGLPAGQNICSSCERLIVGVFVRIKDKNLHADCFKCATCGTSLKNQGYFNLNNKLYCDIHARLAAIQSPPPGTNGMVPVTFTKPGQKTGVQAISAALNAHANLNGRSQSPYTNAITITTTPLTVPPTNGPFINGSTIISGGNGGLTQSPSHSRSSSTTSSSSGYCPSSSLSPVTSNKVSPLHSRTSSENELILLSPTGSLASPPPPPPPLPFGGTSKVSSTAKKHPSIVTSAEFSFPPPPPLLATSVSMESSESQQPVIDPASFGPNGLAQADSTDAASCNGDSVTQNEYGFIYKTIGGAVIRSVLPPGNNSKYKNQNNTLPKPFGAPLPTSNLAQVQPPSSFPPVAGSVPTPFSAAITGQAPSAPAPSAAPAQTSFPPAAAPAPASAPAAAPAAVPTPQDDEEQEYYVEENEEDEEQVQIQAESPVPPFTWPPKRVEDQTIPTAVPIYIPPPETQKVTPKKVLQWVVPPPLPKDKSNSPPEEQNQEASQGETVEIVVQEPEQVIVKSVQSKSAPELSRRQSDAQQDQQEEDSYETYTTSTSASSEEYRMYSTQTSQPIVTYYDTPLVEMDYPFGGPLYSAQASTVTMSDASYTHFVYTDTALDEPPTVEPSQEPEPEKIIERVRTPPPPEEVKPQKRVEFVDYRQELENYLRAELDAKRKAEELKNTIENEEVAEEITIPHYELPIIKSPNPEMYMPPKIVPNPVPKQWQSALVQALCVAPRDPVRLTEEQIEEANFMKSRNEAYIREQEDKKMRQLEALKRQVDALERRLAQNKEPEPEPEPEPYPPLDIPRKGSVMARVLASSTTKAERFPKNLPAPVIRLPEQTAPYFPPPHSMEPIRSEKISSFRTTPLLDALTTAPYTPFQTFGHEIPSQMEGMPVPSGRISMTDALATAPERPYTPFLEAKFEGSEVYQDLLKQQPSIQVDPDKNFSAFASVSGNRTPMPFKPILPEPDLAPVPEQPQEVEVPIEQPEPEPEPISKPEKVEEPKDKTPPKHDLSVNHYSLALRRDRESPLNHPAEIPPYQRKWFNLPTQNPPRTPEPPELRQNVPLAFVDKHSQSQPIAKPVNIREQVTLKKTQPFTVIQPNNRTIPVIQMPIEEDAELAHFNNAHTRLQAKGVIDRGQSFTPSMILTKHPTTIPYYQHQLGFEEYFAESKQFDGRRTPQTATARKSPAFGPPPNPLKAFVPPSRDGIPNESGLYLSMGKLQGTPWYANKDHVPTDIQQKLVQQHHGMGPGWNATAQQHQQQRNTVSQQRSVSQQRAVSQQSSEKTVRSQERSSREISSERSVCSASQVGNALIQKRVSVVEDQDAAAAKFSSKIKEEEAPQKGFVAQQTRRFSGQDDALNIPPQMQQYTPPEEPLIQISESFPQKSQPASQTSFPTSFPQQMVSPQVPQKAADSFPTTSMFPEPLIDRFPAKSSRKVSVMIPQKHSPTPSSGGFKAQFNRYMYGSLPEEQPQQSDQVQSWPPQIPSVIASTNTAPAQAAAVKPPLPVAAQPQAPVAESSAPLTSSYSNHSQASSIGFSNTTSRKNSCRSNISDRSSGASAGSGAFNKGRAACSTSAPTRGRGVMNNAVAPGGRVPLCGCCNQQIRGPFITALGRIWCPDHFICHNANCKRPLADIGFVEEKGDLYCEYCFEQFLAPMCSKCNNRVKGDCLNAIGKQFHPECFKCTYCNKLFGNNPFFLEEGDPYCEADWNELFTTKCFACGFPVEAGDKWVEALNNNYHSQCFNCTSCKKNLEGQSFFAKGGRPFCKNHAR
ncbi:PDZ and LIM domain protein Zasp isoform X3 [Uranotaenia lowii]|uniref:PDZ and LIM domain protein Zasp isoform X3 n=1 Tax=Uranotaenia lowii TaxID=190385 RepID=UPI00247B0D37|nr:PDZ and LIM domain protein Zasp isoform X3 [Uranotaenia lowii]